MTCKRCGKPKEDNTPKNTPCKACRAKAIRTERTLDVAKGKLSPVLRSGS